AAEIHLVPVSSPRAVPPEELRALLPADHPPAHLHSSLPAALDALARSPHPVLLTGSAFLVGEAKALVAGAAHAPTAQ
ncbi:MAG: hypothetical protein HKN82_06340, partial [Akkermansiaceae bacterium]|nr:hypothetical protein [Akkermansiaceae bacterium]